MTFLAAKAYYFLLDQKVTKNQVSKEASLRSGLLRCIAGKTLGPVLLPPIVAQGPRFKQNYQCPCHRTAQLVLPALTRSFFADT
ncbi:MAG: hypothetical protein JWP71_1098 [Mucilaginibacter sp.]|nr:hypothetical protein [Mucilaginibacter sp.]